MNVASAELCPERQRYLFVDLHSLQNMAIKTTAWCYWHSKPDRIITGNSVTVGSCWHRKHQSHRLKSDADHDAPFGVSPFPVPIRFAFLCSLELMLQFQQLLIQLVHALRQLLHLSSMPLGYCTLMITQNGHLHACHLPFTCLYFD